MAAFKILILDRYKLFREGIRSLLNNVSDIEAIYDAEDVKSLQKAITKFTPDIILVGVNMPQMDVIETIAQISRDLPEIGVIVLSMHEEPEYIVKCVQSGAKSYLLKNTDKDELVFAIQKVVAGQKYFNIEISRLLQSGIIKQILLDKIKISNREKEVILYLAKGLSTKQISEKLILSTRTIESHRLRLLQKFEAQNSVELIRIVRERFLI